MESAGDGTIVERGTPQLNVQELEQEQQLTLHEHEAQEAFSEHEGETQGALSELEEETQEALSEHEREQQHIEGEAEPAWESANLEGPALPALRKLTCTSADLSLKGSGRWKVYTTRKSTGPRQRPRQSGCFLPMAAAKDGELRHFDAEQVFLKADIDEEIYIEIPEEFHEFPGAVGRLNKAIYGLVQAGRCWNNTFCNDMTAIGFEQAKGGPVCVPQGR